MHQALYRKWRPRTFDEVYGQDHITSILRYEVSNAKFSHAYLFCGSRGTGKTTCAKILAKAVNCLDLQNGNPCGKCAACTSIDSGVATDVLEMDAASNNGVGDIRDIRDEVVYSPSNLKYRVYIIDEVHMLSTSAFNALLKTLEEPPEHVVFILATTELQKLPATIISRCQRFDFRRISTSILRDHLMRIAEKENIKITEGAATMLAKHAQGGMRDAISLLDLCASSRRGIDEMLVAEAIGSSGRENMLKVVEAIAKKNYDVIFDAVNEVVRSSRDITVFWQDLISVYRDMLVVKSSKNASAYLDLTDSETEALTSAARLFSIETLSYHCAILQDAYASMLKANAVRRIVAELALVRMCDERLSDSTGAILSRLSALENSVASGVTVAIPETEENTAPVQKAERPKRQAKAVKNEDDIFKSDGPVSASVNQSNPTAKSASDSANGARTLRPFRNRAEVIAMMDDRDIMTSSYFKRAKWYVDGNGRIVLKFENDFTVESAKRFGGDQLFVNAVKSVTGKTISANDVSYEIESGKESDAKIDQIIDAIENN